MLNLPLSNLDKDEEMLFEVVNNKSLMPDFLKIYPLTLIKKREYQKRMWKMYEEGLWQPYNKEQLLHLLLNFKMHVLEFVRIQRIQRQFDEDDLLYKDFKLRNILEQMLKERNQKCKCIRCQELETYKANKQYIINDTYFESTQTSKNDYYISLKSATNDLLLGYIRICLGDKAIVREIKVIGKSSEVGEKGHLQGNGLGKQLIEKAESLAIERDYDNLYINASYGVHHFFFQLGYNFNDHFLEKTFNDKLSK